VVGVVVVVVIVVVGEMVMVVVVAVRRGWGEGESGGHTVCKSARVGSADAVVVGSHRILLYAAKTALSQLEPFDGSVSGAFLCFCFCFCFASASASASACAFSSAFSSSNIPFLYASSPFSPSLRL